MAMSPSAENYELGRGIVSLAELLNGLYQPERDCGNVTDMKLAVDPQTLEHQSSRSGLKNVDKEVVTEMKSTLSFTADEITRENLKMFMLGTSSEVVQPASDETVEVVANGKGYYYDLGKKRVGTFKMRYTGAGVTSPAIPVVGETISGVSASAVVLAVSGTAMTGEVLLNMVTGTFTAGEEVNGNDSTTPSRVKAVTPPALDTGVVSVVDKLQPTTVYRLGRDFQINSRVGRIFIPDTSTIPAGNTIIVGFSALETKVTTISALQTQAVEAKVHFVSHNAAGQDREVIFYKVSLKPSGDFAFIGTDSWTQVAFEGKVLSSTVDGKEAYIHMIDVEDV